MCGFCKCCVDGSGGVFVLFVVWFMLMCDWVCYVFYFVGVVFC